MQKAEITSRRPYKCFLKDKDKQEKIRYNKLAMPRVQRMAKRDKI